MANSWRARLPPADKSGATGPSARADARSGLVRPIGPITADADDVSSSSRPWDPGSRPSVARSHIRRGGTVPNPASTHTSAPAETAASTNAAVPSGANHSSGPQRQALHTTMSAATTAAGSPSTTCTPRSPWPTPRAAPGPVTTTAPSGRATAARSPVGSLRNRSTAPPSADGWSDAARAVAANHNSGPSPGRRASRRRQAVNSPPGRLATGASAAPASMATDRTLSPGYAPDRATSRRCSIGCTQGR